MFFLIPLPFYLHSIVAFQMRWSLVNGTEIILIYSVLGEALGLSNVVPLPYDKIIKDPDSLVVLGFPDGIHLQKPSEYSLKSLMLILENSHRIRFKLKR